MGTSWQITLGEKIQALRRTRGLDLRELAKRSNMYWIELDRYERGQQTPDLHKLYRLAAQLETDLHELLPAEACCVESDAHADEMLGPVNASQRA